ncbi:MAG: DNA internalization-related competence protein ComEC/Rec2 [Methylophilaceae bacterium]|nr:DNA internalization-related competence protein ComEC/Rec2 [Methylophilaceae bacterium]
MTLLALFFVFGVWVMQQMPDLPNWPWLLALIPIALITFVFHRSQHALLKLLAPVCLILFAFVAGFMWAATIAHFRLADELPKAWENESVQIIGVVAAMPQWVERGERFEFDVEQVLTRQATVPSHISLTQYSGDFFRINVDEAAIKTNIFHAGQRWRLTVKLKRPHGVSNPHGFDFEAWVLERNIRATGSVRKHTENQLVQNFVPRPGYVVEAAREKIRDRMRGVLKGTASAEVLQALVIGDDSGILAADWQVFLRTGVNHLISISGLHITMLAGLAYAFVYALWRRNERLTLRFPTRKAAVLAGLVAATLYSLLAGFSVPTQGTLYMLAVFALALWSGRNVSIGRVLAMALVLVVLLDPWAVLAPGFWLSFGAVAIMAYALGGRVGQMHWLREAMHTQWAVTLGLLPLLLVMFQQVSVISPLANAFAIPLVSLVVVPLALLGALLPIDAALQLSAFIMNHTMQILQWCAALPMATWQQQAPPVWALPLAMLGVLWMLLPRGFPLRWLGMAALLPMFLLQPLRPAIGAMQVTVLDVGQGLAVTVQTASHALLYDAGPRYSSQSDAGSRIVVPYLRAEGLRHLDGFVISHNDNDHSGGMASVLAQVPVNWVASSLPEHAEALAAHEHMLCYSGQAWVWDGVLFEVLHPAWDSYENRFIKDNNRSCVLRISSEFGSLILTGDIESSVEQSLLQTLPKMLNADVLVAPHHGSKSSSSAPFLAAVHPSIAIFTSGYLNRFGHPKPEVLERYRQVGSQPYRSDSDGAILLNFSSKQSIAVTRWRTQARRYWQSNN